MKKQISASLPLVPHATPHIINSVHPTEAEATVLVSCSSVFEGSLRYAVRWL
jgi:hypothetical protein